MEGKGAVLSADHVERTIEALLEERRTFAPLEAFSETANASDHSIYAEADMDH